MPWFINPLSIYQTGKTIVLDLLGLRQKLAIEFEDAPPFRRYESTDGEFSHQHYAIGIRNIDPLHHSQDGLKVMLTKLQRTRQRFNLPIELQYRDRSIQRHHLNPDDRVFIDVLSFEIRVTMETESSGFFINFHGDNETDYSMPCENCRIRIEVSASTARPISKDFEIGSGFSERPTAENPNHKVVVFFMKEVTQ